MKRSHVGLNGQVSALLLDVIVSLLVGFALDLLSVVLVLRKNRRGRGPSRLPVVPIFFYCLPAVAGYPVPFRSWPPEVGIFVTFHFILHYAIPAFDRRFVVEKS
jgi:hypothetical protein